jgi:hypothetical protein
MAIIKNKKSQQMLERIRAKESSLVGMEISTTTNGKQYGGSSKSYK